MRKVYKAVFSHYKGNIPKYKKWEFLFSCIDASDIYTRLDTMGISKHDVIISKWSLYY